jgi:hypothetical protein
MVGQSAYTSAWTRCMKCVRLSKPSDAAHVIKAAQTEIAAIQAADSDAQHTLYTELTHNIVSALQAVHKGELCAQHPRSLSIRPQAPIYVYSTDTQADWRPTAGTCK